MFGAECLFGSPDQERVAIAQTPYSSIPGASSRLERVAGATTDIQYVVHQGFTRHEATFWVGANALIRMRALNDIATSAVEEDVLVHRYVHDRTVIEDTESSVDLAAAGWTLVNYPERLSYSATPPDFGAIAASNLAFLILLLSPFDQRLGPFWLPLLGVPYLLLYARDLKLSGHRRRDVVNVAALNLILLPVNLGGVAKSIQQVVLRRKTPFGRTPKIAARTPTPALYILGIYGLLLLNVTIVATDVATARWWHAGFASATLALVGYGVQRFLGVRNTTKDLTLAVSSRSHKPRHRLTGELETAEAD